MDDLDRSDPERRSWLHEAIRRVEADSNRSADTHLVPFPLAGMPGIDLYLSSTEGHEAHLAALIEQLQAYLDTGLGTSQRDQRRR